MIDYTEEEGDDVLIENGIFTINVAELKIHPIAEKIYGYKRTKKDIKVLAETMKIVGQLEPILINTDNEIISGNRRYKAALYGGIATLNAIRIPKTDDEGDKIAFHNQQRKKSPIQIIHEAEQILNLLGKNQGQRKDLLGDDPSKPFGKIGEDRFAYAAKLIGDISGTTLRKIINVVEFEKESHENKSFGLVARIINNEISANRANTLVRDIVQERKEREKRKTVKIKTTYSNDDFNIYNKSSDNMKEVKSHSVQVVFTSPPYYNLRNYGNSEEGKPELGHENSPKEFVENLGNHFREVKRVLKKTGSFFLNIGETYNRGENLLIPTRLILHLCDKEGWYLVNEIIWKKTNPLPQPTAKRLQPTYEKIYHLVQDPEKYYYQEFKIWNDNEQQIIRAPGDRNAETTERQEGGFTLKRSYQKFKDFMDEQTVIGVITGTNAAVRQTELKKDGNSTDHPALMPDYLPLIPILTTSQIGDIVLDPFSGSGTTGRTSVLLGRKYIGYELNQANYDLSIGDLTRAITEKSEDNLKSISV
jgi:DNA modification methylase